MTSSKTAVISALFADRLRDDGTPDPSRLVVSLSEVTAAIARTNAQRAARAANTGQKPPAPLSDRNPANFWKDFIRTHARAVANWPADVLACGYGGRSAKSIPGGCFRFVPLNRVSRRSVSRPPRLRRSWATRCCVRRCR